MFFAKQCFHFHTQSWNNVGFQIQSIDKDHDSNQNTNQATCRNKPLLETMDYILVPKKIEVPEEGKTIYDLKVIKLVKTEI